MTGFGKRYRDTRFDWNTVRDSGNVKRDTFLTKIQCGIRETLNGIRGLTKIQLARFGKRCLDTEFNCNSGIGIRQSLCTRAGLGKKRIFRMAMTEVRGERFSWKGSGNPGPPSPDPASNTKQRQSCRTLYTLRLKTAVQLNMRRWHAAAGRLLC